MIDLHMHTFWSDGELVPAELVQRARAKGVTAMAITDHMDHSNLDLIVPALVRFCAAMKRISDMIILPGCELTHVPPAGIAELVKKARRLGAKMVVVHGETPVEPVPPGTNHAALLAGVDVLAHPGLITEDDVKLAAMKNIPLEISARKGHSLGNGRVAALARRFGAPLVLNTDAHAPGDLIDDIFARTVALGAGLDPAEFTAMQARAEAIVKAALKRRTKP
jgi:putative hydrolase